MYSKADLLFCFFLSFLLTFSAAKPATGNTTAQIPVAQKDLLRLKIQLLCRKTNPSSDPGRGSFILGKGILRSCQPPLLSSEQPGPFKTMVLATFELPLLSKYLSPTYNYKLLRPGSIFLLSVFSGMGLWPSLEG